MSKANSLRIRHFLASGMVAMLGYGSPASAADLPDFTLTLPAGQACASFNLQIDGWAGKNHFKEFKDKNGFVRSIVAGTGATLRYTNCGSGDLADPAYECVPGATFSSRSNGAATHTTTYTPDGNFTQKSTGHTVVILFPTDIPAGPSTTLYAGGQVVFFVDVAPEPDVWTLKAESGHKIDICAALL